MEAETIITLLLGAAGSILAVLCTVIGYLYRQQQQQHEREITKRDTKIKELETTIHEMDTKAKDLYQRVLRKLNGDS